MPRVPFESLPSDARLWVFPADRSLSSSEEEALLEEVDGFLDEWAAHGSPLTAAREWLERQFLLVAVDQRTVPPSGCSIDALVRRLRELGESRGLTLLEHGSVWYRAEDGIRRVSRLEFAQLAARGQVRLTTPVFDTSITELAKLRGGEWERPAGASWHRRAFFRN